MPQRRDDPYLNFNFRVEIEGLEVAGFSEVQIPEGRIEAVAYREGTDRTSAARLLPGRVEWGWLQVSCCQSTMLPASSSRACIFITIAEP